MPNAHEHNRRIGRGVNIFGYDPAWRDPTQRRMQPHHFSMIREAGFHSVRLPIHPFRAMDKNHVIPESHFSVVEWVIENAIQNGLVLLLDFHEFGAVGRDPEAGLPRFIAFWEQFASRYAGLPDRVFFELMNEPNGKLTPDLWNTWITQAHPIIRGTNPERTLVIGPGVYNTIQQLPNLELPQDDRNIIVTIHYYNPMKVTHQGAGFGGNHPAGVDWGTEEDIQAMVDHLDEAQAWSEANDRPLFLGEFGVFDAAAMETRVRWTSTLAREAEKRGISWAYWQFDKDFILYDIEADHWIEPLRDALVPR